MKGMWRSRTMWWSFLLVIFGALADNSSYLENLLDPKVYSVTVITIGVITAILRLITTKPLDNR